MSNLNTLLKDHGLKGESMTSASTIPAATTPWWDALAGTDGARAAEARRNLITYYAPLVTQVALRMIVRLPDTVELGDLVSYGMFGLIDAIEKFDPERGYKFETYAATRVRGAIIDELRAADWVPRSVRSKARQVEAATRALEQQEQCRVTNAAVADRLGWEVGDVRAVRAQVALSYVAPLGGLPRDGSEIEREVSARSLRVPSASQAMDVRETLQLLGQAIRGVREREQEVLRLYYFEDLTLGQIGKILGVTESRVSQIHSCAVAKLRETLVRTGAFD
ncbi:MAG TPA: FliA/WhiG family RNA polymerase sigma factor [Demequinaceae bacterium]